MNGKILLAGALAVAGAAGGYWWIATPHATEAEAAQLRTRLEAALGPAAKAVTITPAGNHYDLRLSPETALTPLLKDTPIKASVSPLALRLTAEDKGIWHVESDPQPLEIHLTTPTPDGKGETHFDYRIDGLHLAGRYSETLQFYTELTSDLAGITMHQTQPLGPDMVSTVSVTQGPTQSKSVARQGAAGIDLTTQVTIASLLETVSVPLPRPEAATGVPAPAAREIVIRTGAMTTDGGMTGLRWPEILTLARRIIALQPQGKPLPEAVRPEIAKLVVAALPLFEEAHGTFTTNDLKVEAEGMSGTLAHVAVEADISGLTERGHLREAIAFDGLNLPQGLVPDWVGPILPQEMRVDASVADFNLKAVLELIFDRLVKGETVDGPEFKALMDTTIMPEGSFTVALLPSRITGPGYRFDAEAQAKLTPVQGPPKSFSAKLRLAGLDTLLTALQKAPEDVRQVSMALMMTRGFAKVEPDGALSWALTTTPEGFFTVNGTQLGGMIGAMP